MKGKKKTERAAASSPVSVDLTEMERLLVFMAEHGLEEFEYSRGDLHVRLRRSGANPRGALGPPAPSAPEIVVAAPGSPAGEVAANPAPAREVAGEAALRAEDLQIIKSPIVGTFYEGPSPGAEAFVKVGDQVEVGQVLCIIEAMKLMNEIESDVAGEVVRVYVQNGQPVEYGESLFAIRPTRKK